MEKMSIKRIKSAAELSPDQIEQFSGGYPALGIYRLGFCYKKESMQYFKSCVGDDTYQKAMNSDAGRAHHYVVARTLLNQSDWEKFVWIEEHGSLQGFPG